MVNRDHHQRRIGRRPVLKRIGLGAGAAAALSLIGCGEQRPSTTQPSEIKQPKRGGTLTRRAQEGGVYPSGFDPHTVVASEAGIMGMFYQGLVRTNPRKISEIEPEIAQKWEQRSETEIVFTLQPSIKWQNKPPLNGRALTVDDVVFSFNRLRTDRPNFASRSLLASVDKIEAAGGNTMRLTLKQPDATTLMSLTALTMLVLPPELIEADGKFGAVSTPVGTGAFILQTSDEASATLVRNPDFWKPGLPYMDTIKLVRIGDPQSWWAGFLTGQVDLAYVPGTDAKKFFAEQGNKFNLEWFSDVGLQAMYPNLRKKPFDDARVYRALRLLVDHEEAMDHGATWHGRGYMSAAFPAALADWDFTEEEYISKFLEFKRPKDEAAREAVALLSAAGFSRTNPLKFTIRHLATADWLNAHNQLLQAEFHKFSQGSLQVELHGGDVPTINTALANGDFEYGQTGMVAPQTEPDSIFRTFFYTNGARNYGKWSDTRLDQMVDKQRAIFDVGQRRSAVKEVLQYLIDNAPYTPWNGRYTPNATQLKVQNFAPEGNSAIWGFQYEHVWLDT